MKLSSVTFNVEIRDFPRIAHVELANPPERIKGWAITIEGPSVYLSGPARGDDKSVATIEIPRSACSFRWLSNGPVSSSAKYGPQVIGVFEEKGKK